MVCLRKPDRLLSRSLSASALKPALTSITFSSRIIGSSVPRHKEYKSGSHRIVVHMPVCNAHTPVLMISILFTFLFAAVNLEQALHTCLYFEIRTFHVFPLLFEGINALQQLAYNFFCRYIPLVYQITFFLHIFLYAFVNAL
ncbi:hypothetical protein VCUG_01407 [Vavraia culicis subsp. floridensis]|uniref:Uncharacterized protein n=1 Tax=Vavraia culicis (isolate floridensis) TaxID=948595 RepID=L2GU28_VAVCU|nr:uncharacterized protein VCUG_01407 [Vavraia culicis subsp. floridensis]ELA47134.1 hypothetical protein VCUG_01407 [Vavraia culicis subsp. floridensis]